MKKPLIILTGPTAVGKTALSIKLAKAVDAEIISADSMQVYKEMNIGSAKIRKEEMQGIPHYLIDVLSPEDEFNVVKFQQMAKQAMDEIYKKGKLPLITGGTGFYIQSVLYDVDFAKNPPDSSIRSALEKEAKERGAYALHEKLLQVDPKSYEEIHENNVKKVIRALEYFYQTNQPISAHNEEERKKESPYQFAYFVLNRDRDLLYERINRRVDAMLSEGLVKEVAALKEKGYDRSLVSMQGLGYKEILAYLSKETSFEEAVAILKRDTRHFAKRQLTWFRREREVVWLNKTEGKNDDRLLAEIISVLQKKEIISAEKWNGGYDGKRDKSTIKRDV